MAWVSGRRFGCSETIFLRLTGPLAVGGQYLGNPDTNSINTNAVWPGDMQIDYVRVYDLTPPLQLSISMTNGNVVLSWPSAIVCHLQAQTNAAGLGTNWVDVPSAA